MEVENPSAGDLPGNSIRTTVDHKTLKILPHGVNLTWRARSCSIHSPIFCCGRGQGNSYKNRIAKGKPAVSLAFEERVFIIVIGLSGVQFRLQSYE